MSPTQYRQRRPAMTDEQAAAAEGAAEADRVFYRRSGHCGQCVRPAVTCSCAKLTRCGCWALHDGNRYRATTVESVELFALAEAGPRRLRKSRSR